MRHLQLTPNRLRFLIVMLLMVGIFFRFFNLDRKVYWHDETFTSLRISGYTVIETNYNYKTFVVYGDNNYLLWKIENPRSNVFFEKIRN